MKVLQVNCVYNYGSTGKITHDIHKYLLSQDIASVVCYGRGEKTTEPGVYKICSEFYGKVNNLLSRIRGTMYGGCGLSTYRLVRMIERERPDVVHLQCINGYFVNVYRLLSWLKDNGIRTVLTLHAEFMYTANCGHALDCEKWRSGCGKCPHMRRETGSWFRDGTALSYRLMKSAFAGFENLTVVSVSPWLRQRAEESPILGGKEHRMILNGIDTDVFTYRPDPTLRKKHGITEEKIVFHATAMFSSEADHLKGGYFLLEAAKGMQDLSVRFLVAGKYRVSEKVPDNVTLLGEIKDQILLAEYYSMADLTLLTSKKETFSMVCAESLCCGTPVVGFEAGGPEGIALPGFSVFVKERNAEQLIGAVKTFLWEKHWDREAISRCGKKKYSKENMLREYRAVYRGE